MLIKKISPSMGTFLVIMAGVLWSTVGLAVKSMEQADALQILFFRSFSLTAFIGIVTLILYSKPLLLLIKNIKEYSLGGSFLFCAYLGGIYSLQHTSVANALILFACAPIITAILSSFLLSEFISRYTVFSIFLAFSGVVIMVWNDFGEANFKGNLAAIASAFGFACFTINLRFYKNIDMLPSVLMSGVIGIFVTAFLIGVTSKGFYIPKNDFFIAICMGIFQVGSGLVLYTFGSKVVAATQLTILSLGEVFLGPLWVWLAFREIIYLNTIVGGLIILSAVLFNAWFERPRVYQQL